MNSRPLTAFSDTNLSTMSVDFSGTFCTEYTYFGVEYADECYCGDSITKGTTEDTTGGCNAACVGNSSEVCGGDGRLCLDEKMGADAGGVDGGVAAIAAAVAALLLYRRGGHRRYINAPPGYAQYTQASREQYVAPAEVDGSPMMLGPR